MLAVAGADPYRMHTLYDEPLWQVLHTFYHLQEQAERDALARRVERVDAGVLIAFAVNEPAGLTREMERVQQAIRALEAPDESEDDWTRAVSAAEAMFARMERGRVLSPAALVS